MESSLQRISSKFLLWKLIVSSVDLYTWSWRGKPAHLRSSRAAESERRVIGNYFSERICYMFLISKCRGDQDLGLCTTPVLAFGERSAMAKSEEKNVFWRRKNQILPLRCGSPNASTEVVHRPRSQSPLHTKISMKYVVNWIPLRIRVRPRNTQPLGGSFFWTIKDIWGA